VRTVAEKKSVSELDKDLKVLTKSWEEGMKLLKKTKVGEKIIGEDNKATSLLRDILNSSFDNIVVDDKELFKEVKAYVKKFEPKKEKIVKYYSSPAPMFEVYGIEKQLQELFGETVSISNGGYVIIQSTEALHAIDVNSGKTSKVSNQEEAALRVNVDAAETIARQLRLRDIGGIIVIDFIDLKKISNKKKVFDVMKKAMKEDRSKHTILPLSRFCLMQITRQRVRQELKISKDEAELDQAGTEAADTIEKTLEYLFVKQNQKQIILVVHPYLYSYFTIGVLSRQYKWFLKYRKWVKIEQDNNIGIKEYVFLDSNKQRIQTKK
jgi:ribonuclease G